MTVIVSELGLVYFFENITPKKTVKVCRISVTLVRYIRGKHSRRMHAHQEEQHHAELL